MCSISGQFVCEYKCNMRFAPTHFTNTLKQLTQNFTLASIRILYKLPQYITYIFIYDLKNTLEHKYKTKTKLYKQNTQRQSRNIEFETYYEKA